MPDQPADPATDPVPAQPGKVRLAPGVIVPEGVLRLSFTTSRGPGGQNVNKRSTAAELRVALDDLPLRADAKSRLRRIAGARLTGSEEIILVSDETRSQARNRDAVIERLAEMVREALVKPKPRKKTRPSRGAVERRIKAKKERGEKKSRRGPVDW